MKRTTAIRHAKEISANLRGLGGIIATPGCEHEAYKVDRLWVFGSTAKGAANPGDLDLLIQGREIGHRGDDRGPHRNYYLYERFRSRLSPRGHRLVPRSSDEAFKAIVGQRRRAEIHEIDKDGRMAWPRAMLYPRDESYLLVEPSMGHDWYAGEAFIFGQTWRSPKGVYYVVNGYEFPSDYLQKEDRLVLLTRVERVNPEAWRRIGSMVYARERPVTIKRPWTAIKGWSLVPNSCYIP